MSKEVCGWFLVGPMVAVCADDAPTEEDARRMTDAWVASVMPIYTGQKDRGACFVCGRAL